MKPGTINYPVKKLRNYSSSGSLRSSQAPPVIVQKQHGQFTSALAHEIRNPLSTINLACGMLHKLAAGDQQKDYLDIILRASWRVNELINELLVYQQAIEGKPEISCIKEVLDEVLQMSEDRILLNNVTVVKDYAIADCCIRMNKQKIKIALTNIIINAIDAMPQKNGHLKLTMKLVNKKCLIEIEDNGSGISNENLQHIFKPYYTSKTTGLGLGLSTTLETLMSNQARVAVQSEEGRGTRFIISFASIAAAVEFESIDPALALAL